MAFPSVLDFSLKKNAIKSRVKQMVHFPLSSSTVNPLDQPIISFSTGNYGQYLDPNSITIQYTFKNLDTVNTVVLDGSGYCVFDRVVVSSSGSILSDLQNYNAWAQLILDTQAGSGKVGLMSSFAGTSASSANTANSLRAGASVASNGTLNLSLPLMGTIFNGSDKLIPVGAMSDLQIQFFISSYSNAVFGGANAFTTDDWQLTGFSICCNYIELDASAQKMIDNSLGGVFKWSTELWRSYNFRIWRRIR